MFTRYRTKALFLKKTDQGEANQVFVVYTENFGKLEVTAKAVRKIKSKLRTAAEICCYSEIEFIQGKAHKILTDAVLIKKFGGSLDQLQTASKIVQALNDLVKEAEKDARIWNLTMEAMTRSETRPEIVYCYFLWNLLVMLGYQPEVWRCVVCRKKLVPARLRFDPEKGGVVCQNCRSLSQEISPEIIKMLRIFFEKNWTVLSKLKIDDQCERSLARISEDYFVHILKTNTN